MRLLQLSYIYWLIHFNNALLIYVYANTIKVCLTLNHLLFGRQLLFSSNTTSATTNLTVLSSITDKINLISNHFWDRRSYEYVVNLHETQRAWKFNIIQLGEKVPRQFWRVIWRVLPSRDPEIRGAIVRIAKTNTILKHPVNKLFLTENT